MSEPQANPSADTSPPSAVRDHLTVIIPCLNEEHTVESSVDSVLQVAGDLPLDVGILLIDDGSTDGTRPRIEDLCRRHSSCRAVFNATNLGIGRSVLNTYEILDENSWATVLPGDNELVFDSIRNYIEVRDRYDVVLGYLQNAIIRTSTRRFASWLFTRVVNLLYGFPYRYLNGMKMYRVGAFKGIDVVSGGHAFNAELLAKAILRNPALRVGEVPFVGRGRSAGGSKAFRPASVLRALRDVWAGYRSVCRYRDRVISESASAPDSR